MPRLLFLTGRRRRDALRVTYVTNQLPYPAHSGGQLREAQLLSRIAATADVDLFALTENYDRDAHHAHRTAAHCTSVRLFESAPTPRDGPPEDVPERVWRYHSADFDAALRRHLTACPPDVVHVEGYFLAEHVPADLPVPLVIVEENVEYLIDRDNELAGRAAGAPWLGGAPWQVSKEREYAALSRAALVGAVCREDADTMLRDAPRLSVSVFPNGADHLRPGLEKAHERGSSAQQVTFVGNYSWGPTLNGAWSLVQEIWPRVLKTHPRARLALVGAGIPRDLRLAAEAVDGIDAVGEVRSVLPVLAGTDIFVCPLWIRSGIKVKMLEALSAGCAVVCTTAALRGLPAEVERAVVTADDYGRFADEIGALIDDQARRRDLATMAQRALDAFPTWDQAAGILVGGWRHALSGQPSASGWAR